MKGAEFLVKALEHEGVEIIFGYPGGAIMPVYDALLDSKIRHILVRHEQAAALAADGYARATGKVGVCMATSGPGATNLVTGIANAYMDSIPMVAITGQVATSLMGTDAFQEVDIFGITMPVVKHSFLAKTAAELPRIVHEAFRIARSGRPGPVLIDLPKDIANTVAEYEFHADDASEESGEPSKESITRALTLMRESRNPVVYAGGGIGMANALDEFRAFIDNDAHSSSRHAERLGRPAHHARTRAGNDGHARHQNRESRGANLRPADLRRRAFRRPRNRPAERVRAQRQSDSPGRGPRGSRQAATSGRSGDRQLAPCVESAGVQADGNRAMATRMYRLERNARVGLRRSRHGSVCAGLSEELFPIAQAMIPSWLATWASTRCGWRSISISTAPRNI